MTKAQLKKDIKWVEDMFATILEKSGSKIRSKQSYLEYETKKTIQWIITFEHFHEGETAFEVIGIIDGTYINYEHEIRDIFAERVFDYLALGYSDYMDEIFTGITRILDDTFMGWCEEGHADYSSNEFEHYINEVCDENEDKILAVFKQLIQIKKTIRGEISELYMTNDSDEYIDSTFRCKKHEDIEYIPMTSYYRRKPAVICWYNQQVFCSS